MANFVWICFKEAFRWKRLPESFDDFHINWLENRGANEYHLRLLSFAAFAWTIWKCRNRGAIEKSFTKHPLAVVFNIISCLQRWRNLLRKDDRENFDRMMEVAIVSRSVAGARKVSGGTSL